jgi:hypothetical protein
MCHVIPGPVAGVTFQSLQFDLVYRAEASGTGNATRSRSDRGNSGLKQLFLYSVFARIVRIVPSWVTQWSTALTRACCSGGYGDLTPVILSLSG